jgi:hypothetical protein
VPQVLWGLPVQLDLKAPSARRDQKAILVQPALRGLPVQRDPKASLVHKG